MDMATIGARYLRKKGLLDDLEVSDENNACSVYVDVDVDGRPRSGSCNSRTKPTTTDRDRAVRRRFDLSGRRYPRPVVGPQLRLPGHACDGCRQYLPAWCPRRSEGKLPQSVISKKAAAGYSSYGNQIGLATTHVREIYHDDYVAKRLEVGACGRCREGCERPPRAVPTGDKIIMLGGRTGRDGIGGATGSSKEHNAKSLETCGSEVQKGNAPRSASSKGCSAVPR